MLMTLISYLIGSLLTFLFMYQVNRRGKYIYSVYCGIIFTFLSWIGLYLSLAISLIVFVLEHISDNYHKPTGYVVRFKKFSEWFTKTKK